MVRLARTIAPDPGSVTCQLLLLLLLLPVAKKPQAHIFPSILSPFTRLRQGCSYLRACLVVYPFAEHLPGELAVGLGEACRGSSSSSQKEFNKRHVSFTRGNEERGWEGACYISATAATATPNIRARIDVGGTTINSDCCRCWCY